MSVSSHLRAPLSLDAALKKLREGQVVAIPTETVYGLAARAADDKAVARVFEAKERPAFDPLIAHVSDAHMAKELVQWSPLASKLTEAFWPGPLTLVLNQRTPLKVSRLATSGLQTLGVRAPQHPVAQAVLQGLGESFVAPSANPFGQLSPTRRQHVEQSLGSKISGSLEGGDSSIGVESTIISLIDEPTLLRFGGVTQEALEKVLGCPVKVQTGSAEKSPQAPGLLPSHFAPRQPLMLKQAHEAWPDAGEAQLAFSNASLPTQQTNTLRIVLSPQGDLTQAAAGLFDALHQLEESNAPKIVAELVPEQGLGRAINDRLRRAAGLG